MTFKTLCPCLMLSLICAVGPAAAEDVLFNPLQVRTALSTLNRVVGHTQRLINASNFARLCKENVEFKDGGEALTASIIKQSAGFKAKIEPLARTAEAQSQALCDASTAHDNAKVISAHAALADAVATLAQSFPADVRP